MSQKLVNDARARYEKRKAEIAATNTPQARTVIRLASLYDKTQDEWTGVMMAYSLYRYEREREHGKRAE
jgi:plasmid maintenance system antidote protein VapI